MLMRCSPDHADPVDALKTTVKGWGRADNGNYGYDTTTTIDGAIVVWLGTLVIMTNGTRELRSNCTTLHLVPYKDSR
jgi:hypothetical protein